MHKEILEGSVVVAGLSFDCRGVPGSVFINHRMADLWHVHGVGELL